MGGCASGDSSGDFFGGLFGPPRTVEVAPASAPARHVAVAAPAPAPAADAATPKKPPAKRPATQTAAVAAPAPADVAPPKLVGLTQSETVSLLGPPSAQWDRPPAKVWHYQGPDCGIDVFFYLDVSRNEFSALRYTPSGADPSATTGQLCLNRIHDVAQRSSK